MYAAHSGNGTKIVNFSLIRFNRRQNIQKKAFTSDSTVTEYI